VAFTEDEKSELLKLKGVGLTVVKRFEEIGIDSFAELSKFNAEEIAERVASMLRTTCWKNSPQAKNAINVAIDRAKKGII
jgi:predicted flap endonuclease-1-like 5' DNA nuclease